MNDIERIEYYLNKDHHKNLFFNAGIPPAWEFPGYHFDLKAAAGGNLPNESFEHIKVNNLGYRSNFDYSEELFVDNDVILCIGDSDTFGRAIEFQHLWPTLIAERFPEYVVVNMGVPGGGADTMTRIASNVLDIPGMRVKVVLASWGMYCRREVVSKKFKSLVYQTPDHVGEALPFPEYWDHIDWKANSYNFHKNKKFLEAKCEAFGAYLYDLELNLDTPAIAEDFVPKVYGRSLGINTHVALANYFEKRIKGEPSLFERTQCGRSL